MSLLSEAKNINACYFTAEEQCFEGRYNIMVGPAPYGNTDLN